MNLSSQTWSPAPSRSPTPTPRPGRSTPSPSSHPLRLPTSPLLGTGFSDELEAFASTSASSLGGTGAASVGIRSRKTATQNGSSSSATTVDADVTRPTLKRLTGETVLAGVEHAAAGAEADKGKGKSRRSFDELGRSGKSETQREVVVHEVSAVLSAAGDGELMPSLHSSSRRTRSPPSPSNTALLYVQLASASPSCPNLSRSPKLSVPPIASGPRTPFTADEYYTSPSTNVTSPPPLR